jgi:hypothetical protein
VLQWVWRQPVFVDLPGEQLCSVHTLIFFGTALTHHTFYSDHWLFGQTKATYVAKDSKFHTGEWLEEYGGVFQRPGPFGSTDLCILDPKAMTHILGNSEVSFDTQMM